MAGHEANPDRQFHGGQTHGELDVESARTWRGPGGVEDEHVVKIHVKDALV